MCRFFRPARSQMTADAACAIAVLIANFAARDFLSLGWSRD
jgi:hypothetical protein